MYQESLSSHLRDNGTKGADTPGEVVMLAYYFPPLNESGALRPYRFAKYLPESGLKAKVVTGSPRDGGDGQDVVCPTKADGAMWWRLLAAALQRILPHNDELQWIPGAMAAAGKIIATNCITAVFSTSPPLATHLTAWLLKKRYGVRWVADLRDPIYDNPFRSGFITKLWDRWIERTIAVHADVVIGNTAGAVDRLQKRHPQHKDKIHLIWNGYDPEEELIALPTPPRTQKVLIHAGSLYGGRHPGELVSSVARLIEQGKIKPDAVDIHLIGYIDLNEPWVARYDFRRHLETSWVKSFEQVPRTVAQKAMAEADCLLLLDLNERGLGIQLPAKLFEYIRIGRPILAFTTPGSPSEVILRRSGIPHVCIYQGASTQEVDQKLLSFLHLPSDPAEPSEWFRAQFDGAAQTRTLAELLRA